MHVFRGLQNPESVTGPMNFKKSGDFFFGKSCSRDIAALAVIKHLNGPRKHCSG